MKKLIRNKKFTILCVCMIFIISSSSVFASKLPIKLEILKINDSKLPEINLDIQELSISKEEGEINLKNGIKYKEKLKEEMDYINQLEKEKNNTKSKNNTNKPDINKVKVTVTVDEKVKENLSKEKKDKIEKLEKEGRERIGNYTRKINEILGNISESDKRISLKQAKEIIKTKDFKTAINEITIINQYPDFEGGSGVTIKEYWLNNEGTELLIAIVEQKQIFYHKMNNNFEVEYTEELTK